MQISPEMELLNQIYIATAFLNSFFIPTIIVMRCRSRSDEDIIEGSLCHRIVRFSNEHPVMLPILEYVPSLLLIIIVFPMIDQYTIMVFIVMIPMVFIRIADAMYNKKYPY